HRLMDGAVVVSRNSRRSHSGASPWTRRGVSRAVAVARMSSRFRARRSGDSSSFGGETFWAMRLHLARGGRWWSWPSYPRRVETTLSHLPGARAPLRFSACYGSSVGLRTMFRNTLSAVCDAMGVVGDQVLRDLDSGVKALGKECADVPVEVLMVLRSG